MAIYFIYSCAYPHFKTFQDESYSQTMTAVAGDKYFKTLAIPHLKICLNSEHNVIKKAARKAVIDHYEEVNENIFCQFAYDGTALLNKD